MEKEIMCGRCMGYGKIEHYTSFWENEEIEYTSCPICNGSGKQYIPMSNREVVNNKSNEELAEMLINVQIFKNDVQYTCSDGECFYYYHKIRKKLSHGQVYQMALDHETNWLKASSEN